AADRVKEALLATLLELAAKVRDEDVHGVRLGEGVVTPDVVKQRLARHDEALVAHQVLEELELARGQLDVALAAEDLVSARVEAQVADREERAAARGAAAQQGAQAREQLLALERLDEVVVSAGVESRHAVPGPVACREHEDRDVAGVTQPAADLDPVEPR